MTANAILSRKLGQQYAGLFTILERVGRLAYKLDLPPSWRVHNVISIQHLEPAPKEEGPFGRELGEPEATSEIIKLKNQMSEVLQSQPDPADEDALEDTIFNSLVSMVYGSNMIERAGCDSETTWKLCMAIFKGQAVPEDIGETSEEMLGDWQ